MRRNKAHHHAKKPALRQWLGQHVYACMQCFGSMSKTPFATLLTLGVIGVALALPASLFVLLQNTRALSHDWNNVAQISLYLAPNTSEQTAQSLIADIRLKPEVSSTRYISPADGLKVFEKSSGLSDALQQLTSNPLPAVIEVVPSLTARSPLAIKQLMLSLQSIPQVQQAKLDMAWVERLFSMISVGQHLVYGLGCLLAIGVVLIIGNTIRLTTQSHREEIAITKLVGGTDAFIRRPFLYTGIFYGAIGGIIALFFLELFLSWVQPSVNRLATLYDSTFQLAHLSNAGMIGLLCFGACLGFVGSWIAVAKHIQVIEPE